MTRIRMTCAVAVAACAATAGDARAATLTYHDSGERVTADGTVLQIDYLADLGERNRVTVSYDSAAGTFTLRDPGALGIRVLPGGIGSGGRAPRSLLDCKPGIQSVTCRHDNQAGRDTKRFGFELADGADSLTVDADDGRSTVDGGDGDDALTAAGSAPAFLDGGAGADVLVGGGGDDGLWGGAGADVLDGGDGTDTIDYSDSPVRAGVSLNGVADDDEGDNVLPTIERIVGSPFDDVLTSEGAGAPVTFIGGGGDDYIFLNGGTGTLSGGEGADRMGGAHGADVLDGGPGKDDLRGAAGDDRLIGGDGDDLLIGGPGSDWVYGQHPEPTGHVTSTDADNIRLRDGEVDHFACGDSFDNVIVDVGLDAFGYESDPAADPAECENVQVDP